MQKGRSEPVRSARLVVEIGANGASAISEAVTVDLTSFFSGQNLEQLLKSLQRLRKQSGAELVPVDVANAPSYRLKSENIVGRSKKCDLAVPSAKVSRQHFRVTAAGSGHVIEDLGSANRTWVNDVVIEHPTPLADGDVIAAGDQRFEYRVKG